MNGQFNDILQELESWYRGERGRYLLAGLQARLRPHLENAFGYHILQIGPLVEQPLFGDCRIHHRIMASDRPGAAIGLRCNAGEIPLESDSVDVVIALHSLEFVANPHQVLRELQRVLTPQGQLLVVGFNPYSLRGVLTGVYGLSRRSLWYQHRPLSVSRLTDWLHLLGCEPGQSEYLYAVPPLGSGQLKKVTSALDDWCVRHRLPLGGVYLQQAVKQVAAQNRPRSGLRRRGARLIGLAVPKPAISPSPAPTGPVRTPGAAARKPAGNVLH